MWPEGIPAFLAELRLEEKLDPARIEQAASSSVEQALHFTDTFNTWIWTNGLDPFVRFAVPLCLPHGPNIDKDHLNECLDTVFKEKNFRVMKYVHRASLTGKKLSLADMASHVHSPAAKEFGGYRARLRETTYRMRDIGLWSFEEKGLGLQVESGPILLAFDKYIFQPWALYQLEWFYNHVQSKGRSL